MRLSVIQERPLNSQGESGGVEHQCVDGGLVRRVGRVRRTGDRSSRGEVEVSEGPAVKKLSWWYGWLCKGRGRV